MTQDPFHEAESPVAYQTAPTTEKKNNKTVIIIIVVAAVLLLCCCSLVVAGWFFGDRIMELINEIMYELNMNLGFLPIYW